MVNLDGCGPLTELGHQVCVVEERICQQLELGLFYALENLIEFRKELIYVLVCLGQEIVQADIVLIHDSAEDAGANVGLLRRRIAETDSVIAGAPWSEQIQLVDIETDGHALVATIDGLTLWQFYNDGDPLLLHE